METNGAVQAQAACGSEPARDSITGSPSRSGHSLSWISLSTRFVGSALRGFLSLWAWPSRRRGLGDVAFESTCHMANPSGVGRGQHRDGRGFDQPPVFGGMGTRLLAVAARAGRLQIDRCRLIIAVPLSGSACPAQLVRLSRPARPPRPPARHRPGRHRDRRPAPSRACRRRPCRPAPPTPCGPDRPR